MWPRWCQLSRMRAAFSPTGAARPCPTAAASSPPATSACMRRCWRCWHAYKKIHRTRFVTLESSDQNCYPYCHVELMRPAPPQGVAGFLFGCQEGACMRANRILALSPFVLLACAPATLDDLKHDPG